MEEKSANELQGVESHGARTVSLSVILPTKGDFAVFEEDKPLIGDGDPVGVSGEVLEDLLRASERRLGIDNPILRVQLTQPVLPAGFVGESFQLSIEGKPAVVKSLLEVSEQLAAKKAAQDSNGKEEVLLGANPVSTIGRDASTGNYAMKVRVMKQVLAPGVENSQKPNVGAEVFRVFGDGEQCLGGSSKQDCVHQALVLQC